MQTSELEVSLVYRASARTARDIQRSHVSKEKKTNKQTKVSRTLEAR